MNAWQELCPLPPQAPDLPILERALPMRRGLLKFLVEQHIKLGPVFHAQAANRRFTVLARLRANQFMSWERDASLSGRDSWQIFARGIDSQYLLEMIDGEDHSRMRRVLKKPCSRANIMSNASEVWPMIDEEEHALIFRMQAQ